MKTRLFYALFAALFLFSCRNDDVVSGGGTTPGSGEDTETVAGLYILNEGGFGSNNSTLDYYDYGTGDYNLNIYAEANPTAVKELGDVGNDIMIYGSKMYIVVNNSNKVEILDAKTAKILSTLDINNGRSLTSANGKVYVSSYDGTADPGATASKGTVYEVDTLSMGITRQATVGYQPEQLTVVGNDLYVANSGGYMAPNYDTTISVVDLSSFKQTSTINVAVNLNKLNHDDQGNLYVTSNGDYDTVPSNLYKVDPKTGLVVKTYNVRISNFVINDNKLYFIGNEFNNNTFAFDKSYGTIDLATDQVTNNLVDSQYEDEIQTPYGLAVNPENGDIFIADGVNFTSSGFVYAFDKNGQFKWKQQAGVLPGHFAFLMKKKS